LAVGVILCIFSVLVFEPYYDEFKANFSNSNSSNLIPPNATTTGDSWKCVTGYEKHNNGCRPEDKITKLKRWLLSLLR